MRLSYLDIGIFISLSHYMSIRLTLGKVAEIGGDFLHRFDKRESGIASSDSSKPINSLIGVWSSSFSPKISCHYMFFILPAPQSADGGNIGGRQRII
jgi:hypothetical protein